MLLTYFKRIIASMLFVAGLLALLVGSSYLFMPKDDESDFGVEDPEANAIRGERDHSIDVLVFGDSESYSNIIPMQIWKETGIPMFVCGTRAQRLNYTQALVERAFRKQTPKVVLLETNTLYREVSMGTMVVGHLSNYLSIFNHHNRWKTMGVGGSSVYFSDDYKGYQYNSKCEPAPHRDYMVYSEGLESISEINAEYVAAIKDYCEENGAEFILISTPSSKNWNYERHNAVSQLAEEIGCKYLDLNLHDDRISINWQTDTRDKGDHLNHKGAVKASRFLAAYLNELGVCTDKRADPAYTGWNEALQRYELFVSQDH